MFQLASSEKGVVRLHIIVDKKDGSLKVQTRDCREDEDWIRLSVWPKSSNSSF